MKYSYVAIICALAPLICLSVEARTVSFNNQTGEVIDIAIVRRHETKSTITFEATGWWIIPPGGSRKLDFPGKTQGYVTVRKNGKCAIDNAGLNLDRFWVKIGHRFMSEINAPNASLAIIEGSMGKPDAVYWGTGNNKSYEIYLPSGLIFSESVLTGNNWREEPFWSFEGNITNYNIR